MLLLTAVLVHKVIQLSVKSNQAITLVLVLVFTKVYNWVSSLIGKHLVCF